MIHLMMSIHVALTIDSLLSAELYVRQYMGIRSFTIFKKFLKKYFCSHFHTTYIRPEDHWSCIAHLIAEDVLKSAVIEEKKFKNIECK